ncbi:hypothetical protein AX16_000236 [Volvariella volvacea WC 439]|nr:hypothetical protein AX16_000236 [Volvariella volvacea WC 439]
MEPTVAIEFARDDIVTRQKFESFKFGGANSLPSNVVPKHAHSRSHSRNQSVVSLSSLSLSTSKPSNFPEMSSFSFPANPPAHHSTPSTSAPTPSNPAPSKRNSHHRRRSSMSTRRESAEIMGLTLPDIPTSISDDNVNLGDKDSIRRRALMALEGKPDMSFSKVEIPELTTPVMEKMMFDFSTSANSLPAISNGNYGSGHNSLVTNKRDSFKLLATSCSSKDQLHTLVEEEEEEEGEDLADAQKKKASIPTEEVSASPTPVAKTTASRRRPATLSLKPLSLVAEIATSGFHGASRPGLRSLSLSGTSTPPDTAAENRRSSLSSLPSSEALIKQLDGTSSDTREVVDTKPKRSSISYRPSYGNGVSTNLAGLPTPEMTPTSFGRRYSLASSASGSLTGQDEEFFPASHQSTQSFSQARPLSASEQHFLVKSHHALLARITDLERALSIRRWQENGYGRQASSSTSSGSRPVSISSDASSSANGPDVDDEMLRLIADLKAERDDLKRDVEGWRTRVADLEKQLSMVTNRLDIERRDAWVARSRAGLLEAEKAELEKRVEALDQKILSLEEERGRFVTDKVKLQEELSVSNDRVSQLVMELEKLKRELEVERKSRLELEVLLREARAKAECQKNPDREFARRSFTSIDCEATIAGVELEDHDDTCRFGFALKSVEEEAESGTGYSASVMSFTSALRRSSSFDSEDEYPHSVESHQSEVSVSPTTQSRTGTSTVAQSRSPSPEPVTPAQVPVPIPPTSHGDKIRTWSFATAARVSSVDPVIEKNDRFFGCLEDLEYDSSSPIPYEYEQSKGLFARGFTYESNDEESPLFFPSGTAVAEMQQQELLGSRLDAVMEEDEEEGSLEQDMLGEAGGITITLTPADAEQPSRPEQSPVTVPTIHVTMDGEDEVSQATFPQSIPTITVTPQVDEPAPVPVVRVSTVVETKNNHSTSKPAPSTPAKSARSNVFTPPSRASPPSSIPRIKSIPRPSSNAAPNVTKVPVAKSSPPASVTPPTKRGSAPTFIPQPVTSSPSPARVPQAKPRQSTITYTNSRQQSKPLMLANASVTGVSSNGSTKPLISMHPQQKSALPMRVQAMQQQQRRVSSTYQHGTSRLQQIRH